VPQSRGDRPCRRAAVPPCHRAVACPRPHAPTPTRPHAHTPTHPRPLGKYWEIHSHAAGGPWTTQVSAASALTVVSLSPHVGGRCLRTCRCRQRGCGERGGTRGARLSARPLHALCTPSARPLHALCTPSARPLHALCTPSARPPPYRSAPYHSPTDASGPATCSGQRARTRR
jgi:hypothetical protein